MVVTRYSSLEFVSIEKLLTDFFRVELYAFLHNRLLFLLGLLLLLLFLLLLIILTRALLFLRGLTIGLCLLDLLVLLLLLAGVDLTHVLGEVLHQLGARAMRVIQRVLRPARTALRHQPLLLDVHRRLGVLAFRTQQILFDEPIIKGLGDQVGLQNL